MSLAVIVLLGLVMLLLVFRTRIIKFYDNERTEMPLLLRALLTPRSFAVERIHAKELRKRFRDNRPQ